ncbi:hypothetical protein P9D56_11890 [Peribacillus simplex]|uniref:hypothetical protein n=1 Tax=Peribacillus simplex TaxID=1478 RepID=UPI000AFAABC9|nr:hypothetical protein [Peribacillus simplex]MEC1397939.1 hypothetical protein [Peribacillus simplex]MED3910799.1 hypothetical protein [Peribacillus simplex]MED3984103.1 hypothetical protein [Peribacillus simplex]MED4094459.1 hypothetical protein [Peribacillus simplex]CAH0153001.1 hypothetical protein SRABI84_00747 [Peribacillus simplex]
MRDPAGKACPGETPQAQRRRGRTARGRRVPGVEIDDQITNPQKNVPIDFRNPLPFRRLSAKPHQSKRLWGLG